MLRSGFRDARVRDAIDRNRFTIVPSGEQNHSRAFATSHVPDDGGIHVQKLSDVYFMWTHGRHGRGVLILNEQHEILDLSNMVPTEPCKPEDMRQSERRAAGILAFDKFTGGNMCHVVFDHLCLAHEAVSLGFDPGQVLFLESSWDWAKQIAKSFLGSFSFLRANCVYHFQELYFFSNAFREWGFNPMIQLSPSFASQLQDFCRRHATTTSNYPKKLYQNRLNARARNMVNEPQLIEALKKKGYRSLDTTHMPWFEQLACFNVADKIVAPHGAGLSNMVACRDQVKIAEINVGNNTWTYQTIAKVLNLDFTQIRPGCEASHGGMKITLEECLCSLEGAGF
jgi:hypothetical protein